MSASQTVEPPAADSPSFTDVEINFARLSVPRLNASLPLHRFEPYRRSDRNTRHRDGPITDHDSAIKTTSNSMPSYSDLDMAPGPSRTSVTVTPLPLPPRLGLGSLSRLLLEAREHFKRVIFNRNNGFSMTADILRG